MIYFLTNTSVEVGRGQIFCMHYYIVLSTAEHLFFLLSLLFTTYCILIAYQLFSHPFLEPLQRIRTARKEKAGSRLVFSLIEPN